MKKIFTLLLSSLFSLSLFAFNGSRLSISTVTNNMNLVFEVDGRKVAMSKNSITLSNLSEGRHTVKIYREVKRNGFGIGLGKRQDVIYNSTVVIRRGFHTDITVNRFGKVFVDERRIDRNDDWYFDDEDYFDDDWDRGPDFRNVMAAPEFERVKESLRKEWFEANRLKSAKFIVDQNNLTAMQVKELMLLFSFENNKLDIAKYAYRKTVDKRNYYLANEALTFSSSKDELARFIRDSR